MRISVDMPVFNEPGSIREQSIKLLEEASECCEACKRCEDKWSDDYMPWHRTDALDEYADVLQSLVNLAHSMGFDHDEIQNAMARCRARNEERGRC